MGLLEIKDLAETLAALVTPVAGILLSIYSWKKTGEIDLRKTLIHAEDVFHLVKKLIAEGEEEERALESGIQEIEAIRGHKISARLKRKAAAKLRSLLGV